MRKPFERIESLGELKSILSSRAFVAFLAERKDYWQKQINTLVREQKWTEAYGAWARFDDIDKLMGLLAQRIEKLKKG